MSAQFTSKSDAVKSGLKTVNAVAVVLGIIGLFVWTPLIFIVAAIAIVINVLALRDARSFRESGEVYLGGDSVKLLDLEIVHPESIPFAVVMDVETTGLPDDRSRPTKTKLRNDPDAWPRIVHMAWITLDRDYNPVDVQSHYITQTEPIPPRSIEIHGITDDTCEEYGEDLKEILREFTRSIEPCDYYVGHNAMFDKYMIEADCIRVGLSTPFTHMKKYDTQQMGKSIVGRRKSTLSQLAVAIIGNDELNNGGVRSHNAMDDTRVTATIFKELHKRDIKF